MVVNYFGDGCFRLQSGDLSLLVNSTNNRLKGDVLLKTLTLTEVPNGNDEIAFPGEYETKGIEIQGWPLESESTDKFVKTVYAVDWEDMRFVFLGHISKPLTSEVVEELGEPDVVFIPTGDPHFIAPQDAAKIVKQLEPAVVIPGFFKNPNDFVKAMGSKAETIEKFVFKKKDLAELKNKVVVVESKS